jgi:hypothetical protein
MIAGPTMNCLDMLSSHRAAAVGFALLTSVCAAVSLVDPAAAADKAKAAPPPKDSKPILTQAQLKACIDQKERLRSDTDAAVKSKAGLDAMKTEIDSTGDALSAEAATLDKTNADAVAAYNVKIEARNALVDSWKAKIADYNKGAESVLATKDAYAKACENRRYDDRDLSDLQKKK